MNNGLKHNKFELMVPNNIQIDMEDPSEHESQVYDEEQSQDRAQEDAIKSQILHSDNQLEKLIDDINLFFDKIKEYNDTAVALIEQRKNKEALIYLQEAERMLEYGAVRGKTIDRNLILCVLNNEAVSYQKEWVIEKAAKYIQALIYNIELSIEEDGVPMELVYTFDTEKEENQLLCLSLLKRKNMLIKYHLIYCALMSQLKQNDLALENSFKALALLKEVFGGYSKYYKSNTFREKQERIYIVKKLKLLKQLSSYNEYLDIRNYQILFKRTQYMLKDWKQTINEVKIDEKIQAEIKDFSIANVMQPNALTYKDFDSRIDLNSQITMLSLVKKVLLFTINFFSIATEIRLIDSHRHPTPEQKLKSSEFKKSELYHLTAIKVFCTYVPYDSVLVKHIQTSYNNHYKHDLNVQELVYAEDDQFLQEKKEKKSLISSEKNVVSYSVGEEYEEDVIKPVEKVGKKRKYVPMIEIPKSPKGNQPKTKVSTNKKKTPRMMVSPPLPNTKKRKEIGTLVSPKQITRNASTTKFQSKTVRSPRQNLKETDRFRETSRNKKKPKLSREKSEVRRGKETGRDKSLSKTRKKSKSQTKLKSPKYSQYQVAPKPRHRY